MCRGPMSEMGSYFMRKGTVKVFLPMILAALGLGLYLWYLYRINYPINWALVALLIVICLAVSFFFARDKSQ